MIDKETRRLRFLQDSLPVRLGGLSATLGRISSTARQSDSPIVVAELLEEAKYFIEWTAAEVEPEIAAELVQIQRMITLWQKALEPSNYSKIHRTILSVQAKNWSDIALEGSGLL